MGRLFAGVVAIVLATGTADAYAQRAVRIDDGVYMLAASSATTRDEHFHPANAGFVVGPRGVVVIDTGMSFADGARIIDAVRRVTPQPIRLVILTHPGQSAIFGAAAFQEIGIPVLMHKEAAALMASRCDACLRNLKASLGDDAMAGTRLVEPDRLATGDAAIDVIGRRLRLIAPPWSSAPGALAVLDERTATLFAGSIVSLRAVPDTRDGDPRGWRQALAILSATRCRHLVPSYGATGRCADIDAFGRYFIDLEERVATLLQEGTGLAELSERCGLPRYESWERYDELHRGNASRAYLRLEKAQFGTR